jgi:carbonic anhydrase
VDSLQILSIPLLVAALPVATPARGDDFSHYASPWRTPWEYDGPKGAAHWSELDPDYAACNTGREQSPIDIRNARKALLPPIRFEYRAGPVKYVINNGHTIRVNYHDAPGSGNYLIVGDKRYHLTQFHFHRPNDTDSAVAARSSATEQVRRHGCIGRQTGYLRPLPAMAAVTPRPMNTPPVT